MPAQERPWKRPSLTFSEHSALIIPLFIGGVLYSLVYALSNSLEKHVKNSDQLRLNLLQKNYFLEINLAHLDDYDADLKSKIKNSPAEFLPMVWLVER
jgi:hypothetical protein